MRRWIGETTIHPGINLGSHHSDAHTRAERGVFGFWVFMMSDLIVFGLMFATYVTMINRTASGPGTQEIFNLASVAAQTAILLASSFTVGMASLAMKYRTDRKRLQLWLSVTFALGIAFLGLELWDFFTMFAMGAVPSRSGFLSAFFGLVPLHGLHVLAGLVWMAVLIVQIAMFGMVYQIKIRMLRLGLFWHFLDIIWVGIFSIVYLGGVA